MNYSIAGIATKDGKIFIAKRQNTGSMANRWEFPGGKVEQGESFETALLREFQEEFHCDITILKPIAYASFNNKENKFQVYAFNIILPEQFNMDFSEHSEFEWVVPEEIRNRNFVDSDLTLFPQILEWINNPEGFDSGDLPKKEFKPYEET